jgi:hypothetical protein
MTALGRQRPGQPRVGLGQLGLGRENVTHRLLERRPLSLRFQSVPEIQMGPRQLEIDSNGLSAGSLGFGPPLPAEQQSPERGVRAG